MNICFEREKNKKKRNKHGYWKNWYDRFVRQIFDNVEANTCQCQWATGTDRLWREIKKGKENAATKSEAQKLMLQWKMNVKKPGKGSIVNFFSKAATKKGELFVKML